MQKFTGDIARQIVRQVRAVNYTVNLQDFTVSIICSLESIGECTKLLKNSEDAVEVGACIFQDSNKPPGIINQNLGYMILYMIYYAQ